MARIARSLRAQINEAAQRKYLSEATPIKVVVKLKAAPSASMLSVPRC